MDTDVLVLVKRFFEELIPFNRHLGMVLEDIQPGRVQIRIPFQEHFIGNPELPALHGGVISALLDTAGGASVWSQAGIADRVSTVDLRVDYLRPGRSQAIIGVGEVVRIGNRVGVSSLRAFHPDAENKPIAAGMGVYNVKRQADPATTRDAIVQALANHADRPA